MKLKHEFYHPHTLLKRDFRANKPLEKAATDISEIKSSVGKVYVSAIFDCFDLMLPGTCY